MVAGKKCLSVSDHFVGLALNGVKLLIKKQVLDAISRLEFATKPCAGLKIFQPSIAQTKK